jgi:Tol biopolymer transport system component
LPLVSGRARWSPDSKQIAFLHRDPGAAGAAQIFIMPADAQEARAITPASIPIVGFEWSPSGRRIALVSGGITDDPGLWVVDANGSGLRMLRGGLSTGFAWAPDDSAIVRTTGERSIGPLRAEIIAIEGTASPRAIARDVSQSVSWSRDGTIALPPRALGFGRYQSRPTRIWPMSGRWATGRSP